jgi:hypothetical protein
MVRRVFRKAEEAEAGSKEVVDDREDTRPPVKLIHSPPYRMNCLGPPHCIPLGEINA